MQYHIPVYKIQLVRDSSVAASHRKIGSSTDALSLFRAVLEGADREHFLVAMLDQKSKVIGVNIVSTGSLTASIVHPREVFKPAILANSARVIVCHNHPSGNPTPSQEDIAITKRLHEAGKLLGIDVLDHLIIGDGTNEFFSFADQGLMQ